jgi:periplasmic divalent cation tolerance protein
MKPVIIVSTYPDKKSITRIANQLVRTRHAACVNITKISSIYAWRGKIENTSEYLAFFKTTAKNRRILKTKIIQTHPYEVPEIAEIEVNSINKPYLSWLVQSTL